MIVNHDKVKQVIAETGEFICSLYHNHHSGHVLEEGPEAVTIADVEGERQLLSRLTEILPGSIGIGEEDIATRGKTGQALPDFNDQDVVWFVDPIDGTQSFRRQRDDFGLMVALQQKGVLTHGWIYFPLQKSWLAGELGSGAFINGERVKLQVGLNLNESVLCIDPYHFPSRRTQDKSILPDLFEEEAIAIAHAELAFWQRWPSAYSCIEAEMLLHNRINILFHANGLVWDNAAKIAMYRAAGGVVKLIGGHEYKIKGPDDIRMKKRGLLYAPSELDWTQAQEALAPLRAYFGRQNLI